VRRGPHGASLHRPVVRGGSGPAALPAGREILSRPVVPGAIQLPAEGRPLILLVDGPTIGGYPVAGMVPRWQLPRLGQLRPGDALALSPQDADEARAAWQEQQRRFAVAADAIRDDALWDRLADGVGS
jgi:5-oxoprolinase (ATP-hydrolysing) subunit C